MISQCQERSKTSTSITQEIAFADYTCVMPCYCVLWFD